MFAFKYNLRDFSNKPESNARDSGHLEHISEWNKLVLIVVQSIFDNGVDWYMHSEQHGHS
jgi:hypothetical protein